MRLEGLEEIFQKVTCGGTLSLMNIFLDSNCGGGLGSSFSLRATRIGVGGTRW